MRELARFLLKSGYDVRLIPLAFAKPFVKCGKPDDVNLLFNVCCIGR